MRSSLRHFRPMTPEELERIRFLAQSNPALAAQRIPELLREIYQLRAALRFWTVEADFAARRPPPPS